MRLHDILKLVDGFGADLAEDVVIAEALEALQVLEMHMHMHVHVHVHVCIFFMNTYKCIHIYI